MTTSFLFISSDLSTGNPVNLNQGWNVRPARVLGTAMKEDDVREVVRALWGESELESSTPFLYPFYRVELAMKKRQRLTWIDGRTGKNVDI